MPCRWPTTTRRCGPPAGRRIATLHDPHGAIWFAKFAGSDVITATRDGHVRRWRITGESLGDLALPGTVHQLVGLRDGRFAVAIDETLAIGDASTITRTVPLGFTARTLALDPAHRTLVAAAPRDRATVIDLATGALTPLAVSGLISSVALDASRIVVANGLVVRVFDPITHALRSSLEGHRSTVLSLALLPDDRIASAGDDATVKIWDRAGTVVTSIAARAFDLDVSADGALLALGTRNGTLELYDTASLRLQLVLRGHRQYVQYVRFAGDRAISAGSDGRIASWDLSRTKLAPDTLSRVPLQLRGTVAIPR